MSQLTEEEIFAAALQKSPADRGAFLDRVCQGDALLRSSVEALLAAFDRPDSFLDAPLGKATLDQAMPEGPDAMIGPYKLLQAIGEGGFGIVYMAEQTQPLRRRVALKVIKPGMDTRQVIARFEAERQALAVMEHPNIAKVLDAGATATGRPYFVMELVRGTPITRYCDENSQSIRQRLELFTAVCQAIQHAHTKGIIHRDIKPTNVLVTSQDGQPLVKVIDFGVAKALGRQLTDKTLFTEFAQIIGTPLYMSPEQAELSSTDIDTRSDIYSLGVLLYELLTGSTPVTKEQLQQAAFDEIRRIIREDDPPLPSSRISTADSAPSIAAQRHTEPAKLAKLVRGELDWIVMKALEKDRTRRYETASGIAADVQHYLADEVVEARPPGTAYRLRKFVRRNRLAVLAAALVLVTLVAGIIGITIGLVQAELARRIAVEERAIARAVNEFLQHDLLRQAHSGAQAENGFAPRPNLTVREALDRAAARIQDRFQDRPLVEAAIRQVIGEAYVSAGGGLGGETEGVKHLRRAVALRKAHLGPEHLQTLSSMHSLANTYLWWNQPADALVLLEEVVRLRKTKLGLHHADTLDSMRLLGHAYRNVGRSTEAIQLQAEAVKLARASLGPDHRVTLDCISGLALTHGFAGDYAKSATLFEEALKLSKATLGADHPVTLINMMWLGAAYGGVERSAEAIPLLEEAVKRMKVELGPDNLQTYLCMDNLARVYHQAGEFRLAEPVIRQQLEAYKRIGGPEDPALHYPLTLLAENLLKQERFAEAEPFARQCLAIREKIEPDARRTFMSKSVLGGCLLGQQNYAAAEPLLLTGYEGLRQRESQTPNQRRLWLTEALERLVKLYDSWDKPDEAAKWRRELARVAEPPKKAQEN